MEKRKLVEFIEVMLCIVLSPVMFLIIILQYVTLYLDYVLKLIILRYQHYLLGTLSPAARDKVLRRVNKRK